MSQFKQRQPTEATTTVNLNQILASEARLTRLHRLFKTQFNVTEPSLILEPYLFLGNCISAHDTHRLSKAGIRYILNVAIRDVEVCPYYSSDMRTLTIDLRDDDRENILRTFDQAFNFIDEARRAKSRVLVHCSHGQSRSPAIVIGYLMRTYNVTLEQCLVHVVKARPCVLPNDGFLKQLILYDRFLVDRRRQRQEEALIKAVNAAPPTEIPIQHEIPLITQSVQPPAPTVLDPPQCTTNETSNGASISSMDSSSLEKTSASSIQSSTSADSMHVIPIQIPSKASYFKKIESIPTKKSPVGDTPIAHETKHNVEPVKEKLTVIDRMPTVNRAAVEVTSSTHTAPANKRSSSETSRSHSVYVSRAQVNQYHPSPRSLSTGQWNKTTYNSPEYLSYKEQTRTKYITEIYDKATNRFVPMLC